MKRTLIPRVVVCLLALMLLFSPGCYGPFNLTKQIHHWNGNVGNKWVNELVFLAFIILPVYGLATLGDALIFNSIEFWTGDNPIDSPSGSTTTIQDGPRTVELARSVTPEGRELRVRILQDGVLLDESVLVAAPDGSVVKKAADGRVLVRGRMLPDGRVLIRDEGSGDEWTLTPEQCLLAREG